MSVLKQPKNTTGIYENGLLSIYIRDRLDECMFIFIALISFVWGFAEATLFFTGMAFICALNSISIIFMCLITRKACVLPSFSPHERYIS